MPHVELYINDELLDLKGDESIEVDYTIFDIEKIDKRGGARSYEFNLPKTNRNKSVLENPEMVNNLSLLPYQRMPSICYVDGVDMLIRFAEIQSVKNFYNVRLYGSNSGFYETIRGLYLKDLSGVCHYQHQWNYDNIINSRHNTSGFIYPLVDWHSDSPNAYISDTARQIEVATMLPALFVEELIQNIVEDAGYEYVNNAPSDEVLLLPLSGKPKREPNASLYEGKFSNAADNDLNYPTDGGLFSYFWSLGWNTITNGGCSSYWDFFLPPSPFTIPNIQFGNKISFTVDWNLTLENTSGHDLNNITLVLSTDIGTTILPSARNSNNYYEETFSIPTGQTVNLQGTIELITDSRADLIFQTNYLQVWIGNMFKGFAASYINQKAGSFITISNVQVLSESPNVFYTDSASDVTDAYITVGGNWDYTQVEILKNYLLMLGLILVVDDVNKRIIFEKFDKVLNNISLALDWSDKLDLSEEAEIVFIGGAYGQNSNFKWTSDDPEPKPTGTDGVILIDNQNLEKNVTVVELEWASSYQKVLLNELSIPTVPVFTAGIPQNDLTQRILYHRKYNSADLTPVGDLTYYRSGTLIPPLVVSDDIPIAWFINPTQENNLGFANNILDTRYTALQTIIPRYKNVKQLFRLNASDINQLDQLVPIYIDKFESYFYISSIKGFDYTQSKSTLVELVKLNING